MDPISIDVHRLVERSVTSLYSHLVTRPTGRAVRLAIEAQMGEQLSDRSQPVLSVVDLSQVSILDFSCADEVVAKLLGRYGAEERPFNAFFVFRYVNPLHRETLQTVLARQSLAAITEAPNGEFDLTGALDPDARALWLELESLESVRGEALRALRGRAAAALDTLIDRRLVLSLDQGNELSTLTRIARRLR